MKSTFLSDSDEEPMVESIKHHEELYDKTNNSFKDKQKERLWESLAATRNLPVKTVKKWFKTHHTRYDKLTQTKSGQTAEKSTESQTWRKDSFSFLVTSEERLPRSSHHRDRLQTQLQFQILQEKLDLRWKSA